MPTLLTYIAGRDGVVKRSSLEVLTRCRELATAGGHDLAAVVVAPDPSAYVDAVAAYGVDAVYTVSNPIFSQHLNTPLLEALTAVMEKVQPSLMAFSSTEAVKDVLGALAIRANAAVLPDVTTFDLIDGGVEALRPVMAAKLMARTQAKGSSVLVSVRSGSYEAVPASAASTPTVTAIDFTFDEGSLQQTLREVVTVGGDTVDLSEAEVVVAAGRGIKDDEGKALIEELAGIFNAGIGASRAVVETGMFPATAQVGQTGKVVSPDLYFAVGISGAIQHVAGMSNSRVIVAINKDANAAIFDYATYGLVGDLYQILPPLITALREAKG